MWSALLANRFWRIMNLTYRNYRRYEDNMTKVVQGVVRGRMIEFEKDVGIPDGQKVEVAIVLPLAARAAEVWGEGLRRCAGALAGIPGLDEDMETILRARKTARNRAIPE